VPIQSHTHHPHLQLTLGYRGKGLESAWALAFKYRLGVFAIEGFDHE
jgi:hypothetical protein